MRTNAFGMDVPDDWTPGLDLSRLRGFDRNLFRHSHRLTERVVEKVPPCWFCDTTRQGKSREHIFPQWLLRDCGAGDEKVRPHRIDQMTGRILSDRGEIPLRALTVKVCADCNSGWMSQLESDAKPLLSGPRTGDLTSDDLLVLARWFTKTAIVLNVSQPYRLLVGRERRHQLAGSGLPDDTYVALHRVTRQNGVIDWAQGHVLPTQVVTDLSTHDPHSLARTWSCHIRVLDLVGIVTSPPPGTRRAELRVGEGIPCIWPSPPQSPPCSALRVLADYKSAPVYWDLTAA